MTVDAYLRQLQALLPQGAAWPRDADAHITKLLRAIAEELARADERGDALVSEVDPRTTFELLADWERVAGLPDPCVGAVQTYPERRNALVGKLVARGAQTPAYFIELAAALGFAITITEYQPFRAGFSAADDPVANDMGWEHVWQVGAPETTVRPFLCGQSVSGEPLRSWGNELLECAIGRRKPGHSLVLFAYGS